MEYVLRHRRQSGVLAQEVRSAVAAAQQPIVPLVHGAATAPQCPIELFANQTGKRRADSGARLRRLGDAANDQIDVVRSLVDRAQALDSLNRSPTHTNVFSVM